MENLGDILENGSRVIVDYAHTPDGLEKVLQAVREYSSSIPKKLIVVFGCGGDRDKTKRPKMGEIAGKYADVVIVTDDNPRTESPEQIRTEILKNLVGFSIG
ncbi:MAG: glutamate ligase domain-containing protein, partial [bacterium]